MTRESAATPTSSTAGGAGRRPVIVVLCDQTSERPRFDGLDVEFRYCVADGLAEAVRGARALVLWDFFSSAVRDVWRDADALEWIHVTAAGVDTLLFDELRDSDVVVTNAHGVFDRPIAEYVLGAVIAHAKDSRNSFDLQRRHEWQHRETRSIAGARALVVGTGGIGRPPGAGRTADPGDPRPCGCGRTERHEARCTPGQCGTRRARR